MKDWGEVVAFALALPETELSTSYGRPAVKVRGKAFVYPGREAGSFAVSTPLDEKEILMETDPDTFWETAHYRGWPAVLVRFGSVDRERIENVIRRAWWDRASNRQRAAHGGERP
ncbi:MmcQ/YjbR family DNA-binding protein [Sphingosinicella sp. LHD-64]|uniref:MmcQ/YjbR family DNA-binding protein n=1 Tax=Sphingosinicella sp. LHD-64 TaxID=3072139 RepID=UPI00280F345F|nr:MmcQ/YjbR family DNA-binding protein [Sphingosinicella sp. LHD-64]MDQ8755179.1 MmcQ/YjbR family DNA-binding protein [Sphingosinicella sp. LHD-64]